MAIPAPQSLLDFAGRVVLVTGGSRGIGAGIALRFAEAGADVAISYHANQAAAEAVAGRIRAQGRRAFALSADLAGEDDARRLVSEAAAELGRLDVLVNNAGAYPVQPLLDMTAADWDRVVDANLRSVFLCTQAAALQMIGQEPAGGAIVNIASIEAENPAPGHSHYDAAKAGVLMHTRAAASELGPHGIRVNAVSPGLIWSASLEADWPDGVARWKRAAPLGRLGQPEDVADACLFLASSAARWITGANLLVDGGVMTRQIF